MVELKNDLFLRACEKLKVERTPVWMMRQAGRYLPEYRAVRAKSDFLTMCKTPELAAEVTIQPIDLIGTDAAILFSDILVIPEAMGMELQMHEGIGPVFPKPVRNETDVNTLADIDPVDDLSYVMDAIKLTKKELDGRVPLIGFSGAPWTLMTYMVEGRGSKNFSNVKKLIYTNPELAHKLLDKITTAVTKYLNAKIESGVNAVQIFDTWGGILSQNDFKEFSLQYIKKIIDKLKNPFIPVIVFAKGVHYGLNDIVEAGANVIGLDWTMNIGDARFITNDQVALQGNLDPTALYGSETELRKRVKEVLDNYGSGNGHIFNLGHGILPDVPPENAKMLIEIIKQESPVYHED